MVDGYLPIAIILLSRVSTASMTMSVEIAANSGVPLRRISPTVRWKATLAHLHIRFIVGARMQDC